MFHTLYVAVSFACCFLSIVFNFILTEIARKRTKRVGIYRYFTYSFVITDVVYSISFALTTPFWYSAPGLLIFFASSPFWEYYTMMKISMFVWWMAYIIIIMCIVSSFLYRYGLLCNPTVLEMFTNPSKAAAFLVSALLLFAFWMTLALRFIFHSSDELRGDLQEGLDERKFHVNFSAVFCLGVKVQESNALQVEMSSVILLTILFISFATIVYCGYKIHYTVVNSIMSEKSRRMHACALRMLIAQALNPTIFLYLPGSVNMIGLVTSQAPVTMRRVGNN
uniref:G protein-coupled receptor n=1 Tax=Pristionchus pacificus TaxID=54126 RepID=A0A2A6C3D4_PRIPA|eukprot:PDM72636.1 G protein-coupled receptor [Pristionchus pacificus]